MCAATLCAPFVGCATTSKDGGGGLFSRSKGAPWTIRCLEVEGPNRLSTVRNVAETLKRTPGIRPEKVLVRDEGDGFARLYYGTYYRRFDTRTGKHTESKPMREDLRLLRELGIDDGRRVFTQTLPVRMPRPDVGDPAWNLRGVDATYSLHVAVFEPTDEFLEYKQAAAEYCAYLRNEGHEAYYYHGPASSSVTVGTFGPEALIMNHADGRTYYSQEVRELQEDELLQYNLLNGAVYRIRSPDGLSEPVPSRLVEVPRGG